MHDFHEVHALWLSVKADAAAEAFTGIDAFFPVNQRAVQVVNADACLSEVFSPDLNGDLVTGGVREDGHLPFLLIFFNGSEIINHYFERFRVFTLSTGIHGPDPDVGGTKEFGIPGDGACGANSIKIACVLRLDTPFIIIGKFNCFGGIFRGCDIVKVHKIGSLRLPCHAGFRSEAQEHVIDGSLHFLIGGFQGQGNPTVVQVFCAGSIQGVEDSGIVKCACSGGRPKHGFICRCLAVALVVLTCTDQGIVSCKSGQGFQRWELDKINPRAIVAGRYGSILFIDPLERMDAFSDKEPGQDPACANARIFLLEAVVFKGVCDFTITDFFVEPGGP